MSLKVLVIGGGGREHALVWALRQSPQVAEVVCAPGNAGIHELARCLPLDPTDVPATLALARAERPSLVVIGPELPLAAGIVDALTAAGFPVFGPTRAAAMLETSKSFAKDFMRRVGIPTAAYSVCNSPHQVELELANFAPHLVVKADGLAAGKGVVLCHSHAEALSAAESIFSGSLGVPVESVVLEEMLEGPEVSYFALSDGTRAVTLAFAQDHKRVGEADTGLNTGGMGAYSTDTLVSPDTAHWMLTEVAQRVVDGMRGQGTPFVGVLFTGFMLTPAGPRVLEFNTRFGDPETEAILLRLQTDLAELLLAAVQGRLAEVPIRLRPGSSACVIAASGGYPGRYPTGLLITGEQSVPEGVLVFHAGTALSAAGELVTAGGRVLAVSAAAQDLATALQLVYAGVERIHFPGMHYRRDIGWRALPPA